MGAEPGLVGVTLRSQPVTMYRGGRRARDGEGAWDQKCTEENGGPKCFVMVKEIGRKNKDSQEA